MKVPITKLLQGFTEHVSNFQMSLEVSLVEKIQKFICIIKQTILLNTFLRLLIIPINLP